MPQSLCIGYFIISQNWNIIDCLLWHAHQRPINHLCDESWLQLRSVQFWVTVLK